MAQDEKPKPNDRTAPGSGRQMDDNVDDLGRKPDGSKLEQPGLTKPSKDK
jgi:hypothetical protein